MTRAAAATVASLLVALAGASCAGPPAPPAAPVSARLAPTSDDSSTPPAATLPATPDLLDKDTPAAAHWAAAAAILGRDGVERDGVYTVTVPRDDWDVNIDGMGVPAAAGLASVFHLYRCPCGKTVAVGQFCVADFEANDVIDALRKARIEIASVGPMLLHTRLNPLVVRFQAEGQTEPLARALREALGWTGKDRLVAEPRP